MNRFQEIIVSASTLVDCIAQVKIWLKDHKASSLAIVRELSERLLYQDTQVSLSPFQACKLFCACAKVINESKQGEVAKYKEDWEKVLSELIKRVASSEEVRDKDKQVLEKFLQKWDEKTNYFDSHMVSNCKRLLSDPAIPTAAITGEVILPSAASSASSVGTDSMEFVSFGEAPDEPKGQSFELVKESYSESTHSAESVLGGRIIEVIDSELRAPLDVRLTAHRLMQLLGVEGQLKPGMEAQAAVACIFLTAKVLAEHYRMIGLKYIMQAFRRAGERYEFLLTYLGEANPSADDQMKSEAERQFRDDCLSIERHLIELISFEFEAVTVLPLATLTSRRFLSVPGVAEQLLERAKNTFRLPTYYLSPVSAKYHNEEIAAALLLHKDSSLESALCVSLPEVSLARMKSVLSELRSFNEYLNDTAETNPLKRKEIENNSNVCGNDASLKAGTVEDLPNDDSVPPGEVEVCAECTVGGDVLVDNSDGDVIEDGPVEEVGTDELSNDNASIGDDSVTSKGKGGDDRENEKKIRTDREKDTGQERVDFKQENVICRYCSQRGHRYGDCPIRMARIECFRCKKRGHIQSDCPNALSDAGVIRQRDGHISVPQRNRMVGSPRRNREHGRHGDEDGLPRGYAYSSYKGRSYSTYDADSPTYSNSAGRDFSERSRAKRKLEERDQSSWESPARRETSPSRPGLWDWKKQRSSEMNEARCRNYKPARQDSPSRMREDRRSPGRNLHRDEPFEEREISNRPHHTSLARSDQRNGLHSASSQRREILPRNETKSTYDRQSNGWHDRRRSGSHSRSRSRSKSPPLHSGDPRRQRYRSRSRERKSLDSGIGQPANDFKEDRLLRWNPVGSPSRRTEVVSSTTCEKRARDSQSPSRPSTGAPLRSILGEKVTSHDDKFHKESTNRPPSPSCHRDISPRACSIEISKKEPVSKQRPEIEADEPRAVKCFSCGNFGHDLRDCPRERNQKTQGNELRRYIPASTEQRTDASRSPLPLPPRNQMKSFGEQVRSHLMPQHLRPRNAESVPLQLHLTNATNRTGILSRIGFRK